MKNRCIYSYEFEDHSVYIGLTCNLNNRKNRHCKDGSVYEHKKTCSIYNIIVLTDYINENEAKIKENFYVNKYKEEGWNILNKTGTGSLGSIKMDV